MNTIPRADVALPKIYDQRIQMGKLGWKFGHITNNQTLIFLCCLAKAGFSPIVEFGTFTGRTAYNLALNTFDKIYTVDIGRNVDAGSNVAGLRYPDYRPGELFLDDPEMKDRIELIVGDSRTLDLSRLEGSIGMVIVDGGHSYEIAKSDTQKALRLIRPGGIIVWDDYGDYWPGVKSAVNELIGAEKLLKFEKECLVMFVNEPVPDPAQVNPSPAEAPSCTKKI
jgi:Methyltransferase domain